MNKKKNIIDPKTLNLPDISFSLIEDNANKNLSSKYKKQRIRRGWDNSELWSFDSTIAKFIYPRLKEFRKHLQGYPGIFSFKLDESDKEIGLKLWEDILDKMLFTFKLKSDYKLMSKWEADWIKASKKERKILQKQFDEGLYLFAKYFNYLWN